MDSHLPPSDFPGPEDEPRLAEALRSIAAGQQTPRTLDARVLGMGRQAAPRRGGWRLRLAAAAVLAVAAGGVALIATRPDGRRMMIGEVAVREGIDAGASRQDPSDVNQDGVVDVLDAWALSRALRQGEPLACDLDASGTTDDADMHTLMAQLVRVGGSDRNAS